MNTRFTWGKIIVVSLVVCVGYAQAAIKMSGHVEAGALWQATTGNSDTAFVVDHMALDMEADISNKLSVVVKKGASIVPNTNTFAGGVGLLNNTQRYFWAGGFLAGGGAAAGLNMALNEAYLLHKCSENFKIKLGLQKVAFGMEGMTNRYDMPVYFYSGAYANSQSVNGWTYDVGVGFHIGNPIPGNLEVAILDGRAATATAAAAANPHRANPALAARWSLNLDAGSIEIMPVVSTYLGRFTAGGPNDFGLTGGAKLMAGPFALAAEFVRSSTGANNGTLGHNRSIWVEPSFDAGVALVSAKLDLNRAGGVNTTNLSVALAKQYDDWRARVVYNLANLSGPSVHDVRLLLGTTF